jgi:hypothetical protein
MSENKEQEDTSSERRTSHRAKYLGLLTEQLESPLQKRLVSAYENNSDPIKGMESELSSVLLEILSHED